MSNLVDRLRLQAEKGMFGTPKDHKHVSFGQAAERIEKLEAALAWIAEHTTQDSAHYGVATDALKEI